MNRSNLGGGPFSANHCSCCHRCSKSRGCGTSESGPHSNPRSVAAQLDRLVEDLFQLPAGERTRARLDAVVARLAAYDGREVAALLEGLQVDLDDVAGALVSDHFAPPIPTRIVAATAWGQR